MSGGHEVASSNLATETTILLLSGLPKVFAQKAFTFDLLKSVQTA